MHHTSQQLIRSLSEELTEGINELGEKYQAVELLPELEKQYPGLFRDRTVSARFYQTGNACYLQTTIYKYLKREFNLENKNPGDPVVVFSWPYCFINWHTFSLTPVGKGPYYSPEKPVLENAANFLKDLDTLWLINHTELFKPEVARSVAGPYYKPAMQKKRMHTAVRMAILNIRQWPVNQYFKPRGYYGHLIFCNQPGLTFHNVMGFDVNKLGERMEVLRAFSREEAIELDDYYFSYLRAWNRWERGINRFEHFEDLNRAGMDLLKELQLDVPFISLLEGKKFHGTLTLNENDVNFAP